MAEEGELTIFSSTYFTSIITAAPGDGHTQSLQRGFLITDVRKNERET